MAKRNSPKKCQTCHEHEAVWAMQFIGEDTPTFYRLGSHVRGFSVTKVCDNCQSVFAGLFYDEIAALVQPQAATA